jgi:uncharacterized protein (DUF362 family)
VGAATLTATPLVSWATKVAQPGSGAPLLLAATGKSPTENVRRVIHGLGGIERFVKKGAKVFLKPNSIMRLGPEYAVNTNPEVVREVARLCRLAGAAQVKYASHDDEGVDAVNGIGAALKAEGATYESANDIARYQKVSLPLGLIMRETMILKDLLEADVFINLPIAKHHAGSQLTIGMKNYMGLNWDRIIMHNTDLQQCIADLVTVRRADLTIVDATRILTSNGPAGPGSVREPQTVIASTDPIAADAYAATLFKQEPGNIKHIRYAADMGLGELNLKKMDLRLI